MSQIPDAELRFTAPVTVLVDYNGSGKSTLVEAIAESVKLEGLRRVAAKLGKWWRIRLAPCGLQRQRFARFAAMTLRYLPCPPRASTG